MVLPHRFLGCLLLRWPQLAFLAVGSGGSSVLSPLAYAESVASSAGSLLLAWPSGRCWLRVSATNATVSLSRRIRRPRVRVERLSGLA